MNPIRRSMHALLVLLPLLLFAATTMPSGTDIAPPAPASVALAAQSQRTGPSRAMASRDEVEPAPDFSAAIGALVALQHATAAAMAVGDIAAARDLDATARDALTDLGAAFPDAAARVIATLRTTAPAAIDRVRAAVLGLVFDAGVPRLPRGIATGITADLLRLLACRPDLRSFGAERLLRAPLLGLTHEPLVLALDGPSPLVRDLLLQLWARAVATDGWTPADRARHALLMMLSPSPGARTAAAAVLLPDPEWHAFALARLQAADRAIAQGAIDTLAHELDPTAALELVAELAQLGIDRVAPLSTLSARDAATLAEAYWHRLAAADEPAMRADLVTALATSAPSAASPILTAALMDDPEPIVAAAALVAASIVEPDRVEAAAAHRLDAANGAPSPAVSGALAAAMANLAVCGRHAAAARLGQRLAACGTEITPLPAPAPPPPSFAPHQE